MDPTLILSAIQAGVSIFQAAGGKVPAQAQSFIDSGAQIIAVGEKLYNSVKGDLSATDQASVDAALTAAHDVAHTDIERVLTEIDSDK